ncbi:hypothetical protein FO519_006520 [Halicephalobus sp. NKZ332]|nr:hypothetical protein FO519_006520 [Halicephalobus sp. NKZ332]
MFIFGNILVTGASRGLGLALVKTLADMDQVERVYAGCRRIEEAPDLVRLSKLHHKIKVVKLDVQNDLSIQLAVKEIEFEIHDEGLHLLVNNAGILEMLMLPLLRTAAGKKKVAGVVNISSSVGSTSTIRSQNVLSTGNIVYGMSKAALNNFTTSLASIEKKNRIIAVSIAPSWTKTKIGGHSAPSSPNETATAILSVVSNLTFKDSGKFFDDTGIDLPY